jgi:thiol:disulfide interchange protein
MARESLLSVESKTTLVFMLLGLTTWYVLQLFVENDALDLALLLGLGVVLPLAINEARRRSETN